jgi:beta-glucanase (GH16 family)
MKHFTSVVTALLCAFTFFSCSTGLSTADTLSSGSTARTVISGTGGSITVNGMTNCNLTVSYAPGSQKNYARLYVSEGNGTGLVLANQDMTYVSGTYSYTLNHATFTSGAIVYVCVLVNDGGTESCLPQGVLSDTTSWSQITYGDTSDNSSSDTLIDGATSGTSVTGTASVYTASDMTWDTLVWSDEFEGSSLKTSNWCYDTGAGGWGNSELEIYTAGNATVHGGVLDITAKSDLTSARIKSKGLKTFKYGRIEARMKCSNGTGSWPAFWMLGTSSDSWPYQGEIDIMEHANSDTYTYQTCHWNGSGSDTSTAYSHASWGQTTNNNYWNKISSLDVSGWHTYAIEWTSTLISFYVDDTKVMAMTIGSSAGAGLDAFNSPFYIIFNFAMGGQFPAVYTSSSFTNLPWHMYVDYVRVYQ